LGKHAVDHLRAATRALSHVEEALDPCGAELRYDLGLGEQGLPQDDATLSGSIATRYTSAWALCLPSLGARASITCSACTKPLVASRLSRMRSTPTSVLEQAMQQR
jgi:hypothetical protein